MRSNLIVGSTCIHEYTSSVSHRRTADLLSRVRKILTKGGGGGRSVDFRDVKKLRETEVQVGVAVAEGIRHLDQVLSFRGLDISGISSLDILITLLCVSISSYFLHIG